MPYDGDRSDTKPVLPSNWRGSTNLNSTIKSYEDLAYRVKAQLGFPITELEVTDEQIAIFIDEALEWFTQYSGRERKYLLFCDDVYEEGCGVKLDELVTFSDDCSLASECFSTTSAIGVTGTTISYSIMSTESALLSVSQYIFPQDITSNVNFNTDVNANTGQDIILKFDPNDPWDTSDICNADCVRIRPNGTLWYELSTNIDTIDFNDLIVEYPDLSGLLDDPVVSADDDGVLPTSALGQAVLSSIPIEYWAVSSFYDTTLVGFPVTGCIEIKNGQGVIYPNCDRDAVDTCGDLSAQWSIDYVNFTYRPLDSTQTPYLFLNSSSAILVCDFPCLEAPYLSSAADGIINNTLSEIPYISGEDGRILAPSALDLSSATHFTIEGLPVCVTDGSIPLLTNTGVYGTFTVCNSAIDTNGPYPVSNIQFQIDGRLPSDSANTILCDITNTGFTVVHSVTSSADCIKHTPTWISVDLELLEKIETEDLGVVTTTLSSGYDLELNYRRKIVDVFSMDYTLGNGGYYGTNLLFSFDAGLVGNAFGFDMQGNRAFYRNGYDLLSYHLARGFIDKVRKMTNYITYEYNQDSQYLTLTPQPYPEQRTGDCKRCYIIGVYVEKPLVELINKKWVQEFLKARIMQTVGYIRGKFGNVQLFGGASLQGDSLVSMGNELETRLLKELREDNYYSEPPLFFVG